MNASLHLIATILALITTICCQRIGGVSGVHGTEQEPQFQNSSATGRPQSALDKHRFPKSKFWLRKMKTYFLRKDFNGDGVLTEDDYKQCAARFDMMTNVTYEQKKTFRKTMLELYYKYATAAGKYRTVTEEVVIRTFHSQRAPLFNSRGIATTMKSLAHLHFPALDTDRSGYLTPTEYHRQFYNFGVKHYNDVGMYSFNAIDCNHDRVVTRDEYGSAYKEFFLYDNEKAPGALLFGPLA